MSKGKKNRKDNGVHVIDTTEDKAPEPAVTEDSATTAKAALEALPADQRATILKEMGFIQKKSGKKDKGPDPKKLFAAAKEKLFNQMPVIKGIVDECTFPGSFAVTVGVDPEGLFFANLKRIRVKYGPRSKSTD